MNPLRPSSPGGDIRPDGQGRAPGRAGEPACSEHRRSRSPSMTWLDRDIGSSAAHLGIDDHWSRSARCPGFRFGARTMMGISRSFLAIARRPARSLVRGKHAGPVGNVLPCDARCRLCRALPHRWAGSPFPGSRQSVRDVHLNVVRRPASHARNRLVAQRPQYRRVSLPEKRTSIGSPVAGAKDETPRAEFAYPGNFRLAEWPQCF